MISFHPAGNDVLEASVADVRIYVFRFGGKEAAGNVWRLTANALGVAGLSLDTPDVETAKRQALREVARLAELEVMRMQNVTRAALEELEAREPQKEGEQDAQGQR